MPSVLAIVSKAIFERDAKVGGKLPALGAVVPLDRYVSKNKGLAPLSEGGALFLVTVRPPDEDLALVRERAEGKGRFLWYWVPESLSGDAEAIRRAVESRLLSRANAMPRIARRNLDEALGGGGDGDDDGDDE